MESRTIESSLLFQAPAFYGRELASSEVPSLQTFFEANPEYFFAVNGRPANPDEAQVEFNEYPPSHLSFTKRWFAGLFDRTHNIVGFAIVVEDLCAKQVWHIGLFIVATSLHGQGVAPQIYDALENWMRQCGARWLRLGVVQGNARAERFWSKKGYCQVRVREGVDTGGRVNTVRVLVKSLDGLELTEYLRLVPRDEPGSTLL